MTGNLSNEHQPHSLLLLFFALALMSCVFPRLSTATLPKLCCSSIRGKRSVPVPPSSWRRESQRHVCLGGICLVIQKELFLCFSDKIVGLWVLRPGVQGGPQEEVAGGDAVLDGAGGDLPPALQHRGESSGTATRADPERLLPLCTEPCAKRTAQKHLHRYAK